MNVEVSEIFFSIQGESSHAGYPSVFIRLTGCNLRCSYCDTSYAYTAGEEWTVNGVLRQARQYRVDRVTVTGGEPLLQEAAVPLVNALEEEGFITLVETNGTVPLPYQRKFVTVMDIKTPSSGEIAKLYPPNIRRLQAGDEVKFVIGDELDFKWASAKTREYRLRERHVEVLFAPVSARLSPRILARWILKEQLAVRLQPQWHKVLWPNVVRGA